MSPPAHLCLSVAAAALSGCAPLGVYGAAPRAAGALVLDVPLVRQEEKRTCGFAAVEMLSRYYGVAIADGDKDRIRAEAESDEGVSGRFLREVLERNGFDAFIFSGDLLDEESPRGIAYHLKRGRPLVVMLSPKARRHHYLVVSGLDPEKGVVVGRDPASGSKGGEITFGFRAFRKLWERSGFFTLLAVPAKAGPWRAEPTAED